jgi:hypothetical protein
VLSDYEPGETPPQQFRNPVHSVRISNDGLVYVADRVGNRIQVFHRDGEFVQEVRSLRGVIASLSRAHEREKK